MQYLCLVYHEAALTTLPKPEYDAIVCEVLAYREELRASGRDLLSASLSSVQSATTFPLDVSQLRRLKLPSAARRGAISRRPSALSWPGPRSVAPSRLTAPTFRSSSPMWTATGSSSWDSRCRT